MQRMRKIGCSTTVVLAWIYCLAILYFAIVWTVAPTRIWWIAVTNLFAPLLFLPLLLLIPLAALIRTRRMWLAVGVPLGVFVLLFGALFLPHPPPATAAAGAPIRLVTFNHFFGNERVEAVIAALQATDADVIALQELSPAMASALEAQLAEQYPYRWLAPADHSGGIGLISRHPFTDRQVLLDGRAQRVTLSLADGPLTLVNTHLHFNSIRRSSVLFIGETPILVGYDPSRVASQVENLLAGVADVDGRLVVIGDFNMGDREPGYTLLRETMRDAFREAGWGFGFTFPNHKSFGPVTVPVPLVRLDYAWLRGPLAAQRAEVDCRQIGADHCMLKVDLQIVKNS